MCTELSLTQFFPVSILKKNLSFFCIKTKTNSNFTVKLAEKSNRSFSDYLMNCFFQTSVLFKFFYWTEFNAVFPCECVSFVTKNKKCCTF